MKKVLLAIFAAATLAVSANAQVNVEAGYVNSVQKLKKSGSTVSGTSNGVYVGASYNFAFGKVISLSPGVQYEFLTTGDYKVLPLASGSVQEHYANVPVLLNAGVNIGSNVRIYFYAGPTLSIGIATSKSINSGVGDGGNIKKQNLYADDTYKRLDVLLGGGAGVEICRRIRLTAGYDAGLLNRTSLDDATLRRNRLHVGAAVTF